MEKLPVVVSVTSKIDFPKRKLEDEVNNRKRRCKLNFTDILLPGYENISSHFTEICVSGEVEIVVENKQSDTLICLDIPVRTAFLIGCTKRVHDRYKLASAISLS
jgi:hypothetical protein